LLEGLLGQTGRVLDPIQTLLFDSPNQLPIGHDRHGRVAVVRIDAKNDQGFSLTIFS
jgi:hypothetical protein